MNNSADEHKHDQIEKPSNIIEHDDRPICVASTKTLFLTNKCTQTGCKHVRQCEMIGLLTSMNVGVFVEVFYKCDLSIRHCQI